MRNDLRGDADVEQRFRDRGESHALANHMTYLVLHGGHDVLGAEHCQHDNPTLGQELMSDWLADVFGIDQRSLSSY